MEVVLNTPEKEIVVDEVLPEWAEDEEAVKAAQDVIRRKELEAELSQLEQTFASSTERYEAEKAEYQKKKVELEKQIGVYWRDEENVKRLIRETFPEAPEVAVRVAELETGLRMVQSKERYPKDRPEYGVKAGERERSYCMFQIHEPAHKDTIEKYGLENFKTNVESCVKMARIVYEQRGNSFTPWTVYNKYIAMR